MADTADASGSSDGSTIPFYNLNRLCQPYVQMNKRRPAAGLRERLRNLLRRGREDDETTEELRFHLEMETEKNVRAGMAPGEARRQARLRLGSVDAIREAVRDGRETPHDSRAGAGAIPPAYEWPSRPTDHEVGSGVSLSARGPASAPGLVPIAQRAAAPAFTLPVMEAGSATLADYAGQVLLLNFWATWCRPCRIEMPWFVEFQEAFAERGLAVLGVSVDDGWDVVRMFLEQNPVDYRVALADTAERLAPFGPITVLPTTWLIDRQGRLAATHVGLVDRGVLENDIRQLLAE